MELIVNNVGRINHAQIQLHGITVIAGNNNTGKSTIGKVLFALFNSLNDMDNKLATEREHTIHRVFNSILQEYIRPVERKSQNRVILSTKNSALVKKLESFFAEKESVKASDLEKFLAENFFEHHKSDESDNFIQQELVDSLLSEYERISEVSDKSAMLTIVSRYFSSVFNEQIVSINKKQEEPSDVELRIKRLNKISLSFDSEGCRDIADDLDINKKAVYIDNPFILDGTHEFYSNGSYVDYYLQTLLFQNQKAALEEGAFDSVIINKKLKEIEQILSGVICGKLIEKDSKQILLQEGVGEGVYLQNLSTGLKSFVVIELLLQKQILEQKDILILDEPEIHLHPEWQLKYAEAIILLQKMYDLNIVITTHSSTFLEAIDLFSIKYEIKDNCNYYLAKNNEKSNRSEFEDVTNSLEKVYKSLVTPTMALMRLREELEKDQDD